MLLTLVPTYLVFLAALISPGPDFVGVVRSSLSHGRHAGVLTALGIALSNALFAALSVFGIATLMSESPLLRQLMPVAGALYLGWLGVQLIRSTGGGLRIGATDQDDTTSPWRSLLFGMSLTLTNPKAIIFFASVFAPMLSADPDPGLAALVVLMVAGTAFLWFSMVASLISSPPVLKRFQGMEATIDRVAGIFFIGFSVTIMAAVFR